MPGKVKRSDELVDVATTVYEKARGDADKELTAMRGDLLAVHSLGLVSGRAQAFSSMKLIGEFLEYKQLAQVIESEDYLKIPGVTGVDDYFEKLGLSRSAAYRNLKIARTLTVEEVSILGQVGFTRRDLLNYAALPEDKRLEIRDGKVINIETSSREEIKDMIEEVIAEAHKTKEESEALLSAKDKVLKSKQELLNKQERSLKKYEKEAAVMGITPEEDAYIQQINNLKTGFDGYLLRLENNIVPEDYDTFTPRMKAALISATHYMQMQILALHDTVTTEHGDSTMNPEMLADFDRWQAAQQG